MLCAKSADLDRSHPSDSIVRKLYALVVQCHRRLDQPALALAACRAGRAVYPQDAELLFQEGVILRGLGERSGAEACLLRLLQHAEDRLFRQRRSGAARVTRPGITWRFSIRNRDKPSRRWPSGGPFPTNGRNSPASTRLGELFLSLGRWSELETVVQRLSGGSSGVEEAAILRARGLLKRQEFAAARHVLEQAIDRAPCTVRPRVILSHVLLQEGRDHQAAVALRERSWPSIPSTPRLGITWHYYCRSPQSKRNSPRELNPTSMPCPAVSRILDTRLKKFVVFRGCCCVLSSVARNSVPLPGPVSDKEI